MSGRHEELREIAQNLRSGDFEKIATDSGIRKEAQGPMAMDGMAMPPPAPGAMPPPDMMDPSMLPPMDGGMGGEMGTEGAEAAKGMKEVALRALDLTQGAISEVLGSETLTPTDKVDATAAALETSGALNGVPPEEIAALAQTSPPLPV